MYSIPRTSAFSAPGTRTWISPPRNIAAFQSFLEERFGISEYQQIDAVGRAGDGISLDSTALAKNHPIRRIFNGALPRNLKGKLVNSHTIKSCQSGVVLYYASRSASANRSLFPGNIGLVAPFIMPTLEPMGCWSGAIAWVLNDHPRRDSYVLGHGSTRAVLPILDPDTLGGSIDRAYLCVESSQNDLRTRRERAKGATNASPISFALNNFSLSSWVVTYLLRLACGTYSTPERETPVGLVDMIFTDATPQNSVRSLIKVAVGIAEDVDALKFNRARVDTISAEIGITPLGRPWVQPYGEPLVPESKIIVPKIELTGHEARNDPAPVARKSAFTRGEPFPIEELPQLWA